MREETRHLDEAISAKRHLGRVKPTTPESMEALGLVCVADAVGEGIELVASRCQWWTAGVQGRGHTLAIVS